ncbi:MAG: aspartate aminotransferase family protein [Clostridia bacterium]|nr:aspartate aminotransferase family protein [Clostridia bacterium]
MSFLEKDVKYIAPTYKRFPVEIVSGKGSVVKDINGKEYIDMGSGIGVTAFGIADEKWQKAVTEQIGKVQHMSNLYYTEPGANLAQLLCNLTGMSKVFFANSGAEANECAIKAARKYSAEKKGDNCYTIITLKNSFHGRTLTTLAATGQDVFHKLYNPLTPGFISITANSVEELKKAVEENEVAGIMMEMIQGEGGVLPLDEAFVRTAEEICRVNDIPLIIDEVQTGNGRTGKMYAYMHYSVNPDIVTTAKGLGGGLPIGACLLSDKLQSVFSYGDHGSTFGGNPVCCAAAYSVLSRIDYRMLEEVKEKSAFIFDSLKNASGVESVSGKGLMIGIKTKKPAATVVSECLEDGVLCLTAKDKVRLLPALNIPKTVLEKAIAVIKKACQI